MPRAIRRWLDKVRRRQELGDQWNLAENRIIAQLTRPSDQIDRGAVAATAAAKPISNGRSRLSTPSCGRDPGNTRRLPAARC